MRRAREITSKEKNYRLVKFAPGCSMFKCDPIKPELIGTIVLKAFRIIGYRPDCDGSLMAELENIDMDLENTGWVENAVGLSSRDTLVITKQEFKEMANQTLKATGKKTPSP